MNDEIEIVYIGELDDIDVENIENFEHDEKDYAIFHLNDGFFATQGRCNCEEKAFLSEATVEGEELECASCGNVYSIVSGDSISDPELPALKIYDVSEEEGSLYLNL